MKKKWRDPVCEKRWDYRVGDSGAVVGYVNDRTLKIPAKIEGHRVSAITYLGWHDHYTKVVIPEGVERIEGDVFDHFEKMRDFEVDTANPSFAVCNRLLCSKDGTTVVRCPPGHGDEMEFDEFENFGDYADYISHCSRSENSVSVPSSAFRIAGHAFLRCKNLRGVDFPKDLASIGRSAFCDCRALEKITIPEGVRRIREGTFMRCRSLREIEIPTSVMSIKRKAFRGCESLESIVVPEGVRHIKSDAFADCTKLSSVSLPKSLCVLSPRAFRNCPNLKSISFPSGANAAVRYVAEAILRRTRTIALPLAATPPGADEPVRTENSEHGHRGCLRAVIVFFGVYLFGKLVCMAIRNLWIFA